MMNFATTAVLIGFPAAGFAIAHLIGAYLRQVASQQNSKSDHGGVARQQIMTHPPSYTSRGHHAGRD